MQKSSKRKANWLGNGKRVSKQFVVSFISYLTYPFSNLKEEATKRYFTNIYNGINDPLLFDGKEHKYLNQINQVIKITDLSNKSIVEIGCGDATLLKWIEINEVKINKYIGIDFAHKSQQINVFSEIINIDVLNVDFSEFEKYEYLFMVNALCYLNNARLEKILHGISRKANLIIIDPVPGLFWDAHFSNVKLYYRTRNQIFRIMLKNNFIIQNSSIDYFINIFGLKLFPLSICISAEKQ